MPEVRDARALADDSTVSVCALFERQVDRTPDAVAVVCDGRSLTYRELAARVSGLARHLRAEYRVGPETLVGLVLDRSERLLISVLAVLEAGGAYVPITPDSPANRVACILDDARPALVLTEPRHTALVAGYAGPRLCWATPEPWANTASGRLDDPEPGQLAYVMYTSGSTGQPKGVMTEHGNLGNFITWCCEEYRDSVFDVVYAITSYCFDLSNIELFFPLAVGRPIRILPSSQLVGLQLRRDRRVLLNTVPSLVQQMLKTDGILDHVSVLNLGGEAVPPSLARGLRARAGMELRNMYGPTETTSTAINHRMDGAATDEVLIGSPIAHTVVYIVDDQMRQVPDGTRGEIWIGGRGVARGYWNRPELTRQRFLADPFTSGGRLYRTGDIGVRLPDGNLQFIGRNDDQLKIRGFRVEPDEVSSHLTRHPGVTAAAVGARRSAGGDRLVAYVCAANGPRDGTALAAFLREQLPPYMVPDEFIFVDTLPLTPTGKVNRQALFAEAG
jgi:amino acid adenylation domain-containing protein